MMAARYLLLALLLAGCNHHEELPLIGVCAGRVPVLCSDVIEASGERKEE